MSHREFASDTASVQGWVAASVMAALLLPMLGGCPVVKPPDNLIAGEWSGKARWTGKQIFTAPAAFEQSFEFETETVVSVGENGRPSNLMLPLVAGGSSAEGVAADIFDVGQIRNFEQDSSFTQNGQTTTIHAEWELTVREASFESNGFRVVYDYEMNLNYFGGALSGATQHATGTIAYDASLGEEQLMLDQNMTQDFQQSVSGMQMAGRQELVGQTVLERK